MKAIARLAFTSFKDLENCSSAFAASIIPSLSALNAAYKADAIKIRLKAPFIILPIFRRGLVISSKLEEKLLSLATAFPVSLLTSPVSLLNVFPTVPSIPLVAVPTAAPIAGFPLTTVPMSPAIPPAPPLTALITSAVPSSPLFDVDLAAVLADELVVGFDVFIAPNFFSRAVTFFSSCEIFTDALLNGSLFASSCQVFCIRASLSLRLST